jgi:nucleotide-binding universal stress UspA family protein
MFKTVLFPVDESRESREAAVLVSQLVRHCNSRLVLLSVVEEATAESQSSADPMKSPDAIAKLLETVKALFAQDGITAETLERSGKPAFTICDVADEVGADLIMMGCRGLGLTEEGAAESVTNRVINLAPCPVMVIP